MKRLYKSMCTDFLSIDAIIILNHCPQSLINVTQQPKEFARILENWFERDDNLHEARRRFFNNVGKQNTYSEARLIIVANLFDILTDDAVPSKFEPSAELYMRLVNKCREYLSRN